MTELSTGKDLLGKLDPPKASDFPEVWNGVKKLWWQPRSHSFPQKVVTPKLTKEEMMNTNHPDDFHIKNISISRIVGQLFSSSSEYL